MVPLCVRSNYSLMWGVDGVKAICRAAARMGYERLALTDIDNLYGLWTFLSACRHEGLQPIVGAELTDPHSERRVVCLVENAAGYGNLCRILTQRHLNADFNIKEVVMAHARGLCFLVTNPGLMKAWHDAGVWVAAHMPRRPLLGSHPLCCMADHLKVPLVATPSSFFLSSEDVPIHRLLRAIDKNTTLSRLKSRDVAPNDAWLASPETYATRFAICPEAIRATWKIAARLTFTGPSFGTVMPPWQDHKGRSTTACLRDAVYKGAMERYGRELAEPVVERIENELRIVDDMGFPAYFLIVRDIVKHSPRTCGRGSGAASIIAYCLGITNVCPLKHNLYFERFLNPGRSDPPDLDVDFAWDERDAVLDRVLAKYSGRVAMVSNHVFFQPRMALREVAKVFGLPDREIDALTKRLPFHFRTEKTDAMLETKLRKLPELKNMDYPDPWPRIIRLAHRITGIPRYLSVHPGGVVITPDPIDTYAPLEMAPKGVPILQWEKDGTETAGLVKIDLLGNRSLGVIRDAVQSVHRNGGALDESRWEPEDDFATQEAIAHGHTMGCFYIESPAMRLLQKKSGVGDFEHLVIHSSIIRPAANKFIQEYIRRLHGGSWDPIHPLLGDVLDETFGIMVYQEDVSRAAVSIAGFSHAEADGLRKILSKKDREHKLRDYHDRFFTGAASRGVPRKKISAAWEMIMSFGGYSFCKPHSASYARVSFQAAYLRVKFPAEFMAAVISNQGGFYSTFAYVSEARRMGLAILPPDIHCSDIVWKGSDLSVRVGLFSIKGLSKKRRELIVSERRKTVFQSFQDMLQRVRPDDSETRALINCGALDVFCKAGNRAGLMWELAQWQKDRSVASRSRSLFNDTEGYLPPPHLPDTDELESLRREFMVLGFLCDRHPMTLYRKELGRLGPVQAVQLSHFIGKRIRFAGWLVTGKRVQTKHGDTMEFLTFEDETGIVETTFFPKAYERFCHMVDRNRPYVLEGTVEVDWGATTLTVDHVAALAPVNRVDKKRES
ncbi:MAG: DNA polymerase III subunit alpha, partial [Deltaproteobacteria bacterium]